MHKLKVIITVLTLFAIYSEETRETIACVTACSIQFTGTKIKTGVAKACICKLDTTKFNFCKYSKCAG